MTDAVPEVSLIPEVKDEVELVVCDVITMTRKPILELIGKLKVGEAVAKNLVGEPVAKNLVGEVTKQAPGPSPAT
ncbi:hypothetical protein GGH13_001038 [Coemansia sp. S155-1]|nr:hypothetical protein GGH13_001038 [Coemansia sp. S155-1]